MGFGGADRWLPLGLAVCLVAAVAALLSWGAPVALADTTVIGEQNLVPNLANADLTGQNIPVFQGDASAGFVLSSPRSGTITSWSFLSGGIATGKQFELAVLAPTDATNANWRLLATSSPVSVSTATGTDAVNGPFPVQIPVGVGYRIALMPVDDSYTPIETGAPNVDGIRYFAAPFAGLGSSQQVASTADNGQVVPIQATVTFAGPPAPPANTKAPSISGTPRQYETLTGDPGLWQNDVNGFTYSWLRCAANGTGCVAVSGSNSTMYTLTRSDVGLTLRFQVIASNDGGDSQPAQSPATAVVQRGSVTAKLTITPNPSCTGVPVTFDANGSVSPDGIKTYSFRLVNLYAAYLHFVRSGVDNLDEFDAEVATLLLAQTMTLPANEVDPHTGVSPRYLIDDFSGPPIVTSQARLIYNFDWDRAPIPYKTEPPGALVRDPVGVVLVVTDYAGHTAQAFGALDFAQHYSFENRSACPPAKRFTFTPPNAVLTTALSFQPGSSQPSTTARCQTRVACVGAITVSALSGLLRSCDSCASDGGHRQPAVLATGFFNIPPQRTRKVVLTLTQLGKRRLHRGARLHVRVTVYSVSPTGHSVRHEYSEVLMR